MSRQLAFAFAIMAAAGATDTKATDTCRYRQSAPPQADAKRLVTQDNWLAGEHLRIGLQAPQRFMPGVLMRSSAHAAGLTRSTSLIDPDRQMALDPDDGSEKSLRFLLDARLYADGIIVLKGGEIMLESYRSGFSPAAPRLLLQATRPVLSAMLATAVDRGRLSREKSVARVIPDLTKVSNLRKISVQRLLDGRTGLTWSADDRRQWRDATGWGGSGPSSPGVRAWLKNRRAWPRNTELPVADSRAPEGELLTWTLERASRMPVSRVLCESVLSAIGAEDEAFWATDAAGLELADGLALSLRDFARLGAAQIDARAKSGGSSVAPKWFIESLAATVSGVDPTPDALQGLGDDTAWRYQFVSLGRSHQAAIVGPFGNSLFMDFDRKIVVAIYASFPRDYSPLLLRSLRSVWSAIAAVDGATPVHR